MERREHESLEEFVKRVEDYEAMFEPGDWNTQAHYGDWRNKRDKEIGPRPDYRTDNQLKRSE